MISSVVSWATGYMIVHGEEGAGWRDARLTGQAEPEKSPRDLLFWVHIWRRATECLHTLTADPPCCHQKQQEKPLPSATSLQHPLQRKINILHTIKERCLKEFCSPSQHILEVNVEFKGNKLINGTLQLVNVERA